MADERIKVVTCSAPVNIAVIKYWGKRDEELILPTNSSISVTLNQEQLAATTSIGRCPMFMEDRIWLNGREESVKDNPRLVRCLSEARRLGREQNPHNTKDYDGCLHICSKNNFPTAAGLASSAAGYACLVFALSKLYDIKGDISIIARQGSGSACRSVYGGFVKWERGTEKDGSDSIAVQLAPASHWPEMEVLVLVVSSEKKPVSSTVGMQTTVQTSSLMRERTEVVVPRRMQEMEKAISEKDFESFARTTMQDSNQFHAVCLDTYPPILYLNDISKKVIQIVSKYNEVQGKLKVAYTFDAGPNAVLYALTPDVPEILDLICHYFPAPGTGMELWNYMIENKGPALDQSSVAICSISMGIPKKAAGVVFEDFKRRHCYVRGLSCTRERSPVNEDLLRSMELTGSASGLQYIIHTKVGCGPTLVDGEKHLIDIKGFPLSSGLPC